MVNAINKTTYLGGRPVVTCVTRATTERTVPAGRSPNTRYRLRQHADITDQASPRNHRYQPGARRAHRRPGARTRPLQAVGGAQRLQGAVTSCVAKGTHHRLRRRRAGARSQILRAGRRTNELAGRSTPLSGPSTTHLRRPPRMARRRPTPITPLLAPRSLRRRRARRARGFDAHLSFPARHQAGARPAGAALASRRRSATIVTCYVIQGADGQRPPREALPRRSNPDCSCARSATWTALARARDVVQVDYDRTIATSRGVKMPFKRTLGCGSPGRGGDRAERRPAERARGCRPLRAPGRADGCRRALNRTVWLTCGRIASAGYRVAETQSISSLCDLVSLWPVSLTSP